MISYDEFIEEGFNPSISLAEFKYISRRVKRQINYRTFRRFDYDNPEYIYYYNEILLSVLSELEHRGLLHLTDNEEVEAQKQIKSETIGSQKVEYVVDSGNSMSDEVRESKIDKCIDRIIKEYLAHTGLMYRGRGRYAH